MGFRCESSDFTCFEERALAWNQNLGCTHSSGLHLCDLEQITSLAGASVS